MPNRLRQNVEVVSALESVYGSGAERRRCVRVPYQAPLVIHPVSDGVADEPQTVALQDFSAVGLGMLADRPVPAGRQFFVDLHRPGGPAGIVCTVSHCRPSGAGRFRVGARYTRILSSQTPSASDEPIKIDWVTPQSFSPQPLAQAA
jgi:hypothetical protein